MTGYEIYIEKIAKLFANSGDPDQMPHSAASDLGLHCLQITLLQVSRLQWVKKTKQIAKMLIGSKTQHTEKQQLHAGIPDIGQQREHEGKHTHWLCWGLTTHQPLWVILCHLPEKGRKEIEEIVEEVKERDREERGTRVIVKKQKK